MSWAGIASNQTVSFNNLQDAVNNGVFTLKNAIPASNEQITKAEANYYVNIDTSYGPYAAKASNQLVVKSNLQPAAPACATYINISAMYLNVYELVMFFSFTGNVPSAQIEFSFDWCTDSGAKGTTWVTVYGGQGSGGLQGVNINLSMNGMQGGGTPWGIQDVSVNSSSADPVTQMYVSGSTILFSGGDPGCAYYMSYENADNFCNPQGIVNDECVKGC